MCTSVQCMYYMVLGLWCLFTDSGPIGWVTMRWHSCWSWPELLAWFAVRHYSILMFGYHCLLLYVITVKWFNSADIVIEIKLKYFCYKYLHGPSTFNIFHVSPSVSLLGFVQMWGGVGSTRYEVTHRLQLYIINRTFMFFAFFASNLYFSGTGCKLNKMIVVVFFSVTYFLYEKQF